MPFQVVVMEACGVRGPSFEEEDMGLVSGLGVWGKAAAVAYIRQPYSGMIGPREWKMGCAASLSRCRYRVSVNDTSSTNGNCMRTLPVTLTVRTD